MFLVFLGYSSEESFGADHISSLRTTLRAAIESVADCAYNSNTTFSRWQIVEIDNDGWNVIYNHEGGFPGRTVDAGSGEEQETLYKYIAEIKQESVKAALNNSAGMQSFFEEYLMPGETLDQCRKRLAQAFKKR